MKHTRSVGQLPSVCLSTRTEEQKPPAARPLIRFWPARSPRSFTRARRGELGCCRQVDGPLLDLSAVLDPPCTTRARRGELGCCRQVDGASSRLECCSTPCTTRGAGTRRGGMRARRMPRRIRSRRNSRRPQSASRPTSARTATSRARSTTGDGRRRAGLAAGGRADRGCTSLQWVTLLASWTMTARRATLWRPCAKVTALCGGDGATRAWLAARAGAGREHRRGKLAAHPHVSSSLGARDAQA